MKRRTNKLMKKNKINEAHALLTKQAMRYIQHLLTSMSRLQATLFRINCATCPIRPTLHTAHTPYTSPTWLTYFRRPHSRHGPHTPHNPHTPHCPTLSLRLTLRIVPHVQYYPYVPHAPQPSDWDYYIGSMLMGARHVLAPEVPRTRHVGGGGVHVTGLEQERYFNRRLFNSHRRYVLMDTSR